MGQSSYDLIFKGFLEGSSEEATFDFLRKVGVKQSALDQIKSGKTPVLFRISQEKLDKTLALFQSKSVDVETIPSGKTDPVVEDFSENKNPKNKKEMLSEIESESRSIERDEDIAVKPSELARKKTNDMKSRLTSSAKEASKIINNGVSTAKEKINSDEFKSATEDLRKIAKEKTEIYKPRFSMKAVIKQSHWILAIIGPLLALVVFSYAVFDNMAPFERILAFLAALALSLIPYCLASAISQISFNKNDKK